MRTSPGKVQLLEIMQAELSSWGECARSKGLGVPHPEFSL